MNTVAVAKPTSVLSVAGVYKGLLSQRFCIVLYSNQGTCTIKFLESLRCNSGLTIASQC